MPPHRDRHRHYGVLAATAPGRAQVTTLAGAPNSTPRAAATDPHAPIASIAPPISRPSLLSMRTNEAAALEGALLCRAARYACALSLARNHAVLPPVCRRCGGEMRFIAFVTDACAVCDILTHIGEPTSPPRLMRARAPLLWEMQGATIAADDPQALSAPAYECAQRTAWQARHGSKANCHRPSSDDWRQAPPARSVRPGGWPPAAGPGAARGGIRMTFQGLAGPNARLGCFIKAHYSCFYLWLSHGSAHPRERALGELVRGRWCVNAVKQHGGRRGRFGRRAR